MEVQGPSGRVPVPNRSSPADWVETLLARRSEAEQIRHLCDTRALHRLLMRHSTRCSASLRAGTYRTLGEPVIVRVKVRSDAPMISRTCPPERVLTEMRLLASRIRVLLCDPPDRSAQRRELAAILAAFFRIHPYLDGNGRVARVMFRRAAMILGLPLNDCWTLDTRGYGAGMSMAIECYPLSPRPLETYLERFFDKQPLKHAA